MSVKTEEFRAKLRDYLDAVYAQGNEVVVERHGKPLAVLISHERWQKLKELEEKEKQEQK